MENGGKTKEFLGAQKRGGEGLVSWASQAANFT